MTKPSLDWRDRYGWDEAVDHENIRQSVQVYLPSPEAAIVEDAMGQAVFRVPVIHRRTGTYAILIAPATVGEIGLIFQDCPEYDPIPANTPTMTGWMGDSSFAQVVTPVTMYHPL